MKKILFVITIIFFIGCVEKEPPNERYYKNNHWITVVDSCEYVVDLGHKGNCKYCAERRQKELEILKKEIIEELKDK